MGKKIGVPTPARRWYVIILTVISLVIYGNTLNNDYVLDDMAVITHNTYVQKGFAGIGDIVSTPSLRGFSERPVYDTTAINDIYRPVSLVMFAVEHQLFGATPIAGHFFNVLLFAACVILLFLFTERLFGEKHTIVAFVAGLLFAVHPIHTEVVANIKSRDELLCFFFAFSSLLLYQRYMMKGNFLPLAGGGLCYLVSLLSKETSISFVVIVPLVCFFYMPASRKRTLVVTVVTLVAAAIYLFVRLRVLNVHNANHPEMIDFMENPLVGAPGTSARIATALVVLGRYIGMLLLPYPLCSDYTFASIPFASLGDVWVWLSVTIYTALTILGIYRLATRLRDIYAFGILFFLATIAIFSNLLFLTGSIMAERFLFFPSVGFSIVAAYAAHQFLLKNGNTRGLWMVLVPICLLFATVTIARNAEWKDNYTLAKADAEKQPGNARLQHSLGYLLTTTQLEKAESNTEKLELVRQGMDHYRRSLAIYPAQSKVHTDLANLFTQLQMYDSAEVHMLQALAIKPDDPAITSMLGGVYFAQGQYPKTLALCRKALQKAPGNTAVLNNMGICYLQMKQYDSVIYVSNQVLRKEPGNKLAEGNMAAAKQRSVPDSTARQ